MGGTGNIAQVRGGGLVGNGGVAFCAFTAAWYTCLHVCVGQYVHWTTRVVDDTCICQHVQWTKSAVDNRCVEPLVLWIPRAVRDNTQVQ